MAATRACDCARAVDFRRELTDGQCRGVQDLGSGQIHGLSNAALDTPWGKVEAGKAAFERIVTQDANAPHQDGLIDALIQLMSDTTLQQPHSAKTHDTARIFVDFTLSGRPYGTRATTVVLVSHDGSLTVVERALDSVTGEWSTRTERHQLGAI